MKPTSFKETNKVFTAGNNPNTDQLPVCIAIHEANKDIPSIISKWRLSKEELEQINKTGCIYHFVMGLSLPPIYMTTENPFTENGYKPIEL